MRVRFLCVTLVAIALLANSVTLFAQSNPTDAWLLVQALPARARVVVRDKAGKTTKGQVTAVTADAITVSQRSGNVVIDKQQVARLHVDEQSLARSTLIGAGVGAGTGATVGGIILASAGTEDFDVPLFLGFFAGIGAGAGAVGGVIRGLFPNRRLIYESR